MEPNKAKKARPNINISFNIISNNFIADDFESNPKHKKNKKSNEMTARGHAQSSKIKQQAITSVDFTKKKHQKNAYSMDLQSKVYRNQCSVIKNNHTTSVTQKDSIMSKNTQKKKLSSKCKPNNQKKQKLCQETSCDYLIKNIFQDSLGDFKKGKLSLQQLKKKLCSSIFSPQKVKKCQKSKSITLSINSYKKNSKNIFTKSTHQQFKTANKTLQVSQQPEPIINIIQTLVNEGGVIQQAQRVEQSQDQQFPYCYTQDLKINSMKINTSHSVRDFKKAFFKDRQLIKKYQKNLTKLDRKAIIIQRAWRNYKTKQLVKNLFSHLQVSTHNITAHSFIENVVGGTQQDQSLNQIINMPCDGAKAVVEKKQIQMNKKVSNTHNTLIKMIEQKMNSSQLEQQQCLVNILKIIQNIDPSIRNGTEAIQSQQKRQFLVAQSSFEQINNSLGFQGQSNILDNRKKDLLAEKEQKDLDVSHDDSKSSLVSINYSDQNYQGQQYSYSNKANFQIIFDSLKKRKKMIILEKQQQAKKLQSQLDEEILSMTQYHKLKKLAQYNFKEKIKEVRKAQKILFDSFKDIRNLLEKESYKCQKNSIRKASSLQHIKRSQCLIQNILKSQKKMTFQQHIHERVKSQQSSQNQEQTQHTYNHHILPILKQEQKDIQQQQQLISIYTLDKEILNKKLNITLQSPIKELEKAQQIDLFEQKQRQSKQNNKLHIPTHQQQALIDKICLDLLNKEIQQLSKNYKIILKCFKSFQEIKRKATTQRGIKTDLQAVSSFINKIIKIVKGKENIQCLEKLNIPMGPNALQILGYMHQFQDQNQQQQEEIVPLILPVYIFQQAQKEVEAEFSPKPLFSQQQKQASRVNFLKNVVHIHNKAIFDGLNQFLDYQRPYGVMGQPFPWKKKVYTHQYNKKQQMIKLETAINNVKNSVGYLCGIIPDKEGSVLSNKNFSYQYIQDIRQDRLERYLAQDVLIAQ